MEKITTVEAKHIFIDIVNYTHKRSVEAQSFIINILNGIVSNSIKELKIDQENVIFIPTGDGMCISLMNILEPYDIHLQLGIVLLKNLSEYNITQNNDMRKFSIRIGINENTDNLITDINGKRNISGSGINIASRIEGLGDENQILVGYSVYDKLVNREKYMDAFSNYIAIVKHGLTLNAYHYKNKELKYLNCEIPSAFRQKIKNQEPLTVFESHYIGNCILNEDFIISKAGNSLHSSALHVLMYLLTLDAIDHSKVTKTSPQSIKRVKSSNEEFFQELMKGNVWPNHELHHKLLPIKLSEINTCFKESYLIVNDKGKLRLKNEMPDIEKMYITTN